MIPNVILVSILLTTYRARKYTNGPPPEDKDGPTPLAKDPPTEGSVDYFANLVRPHLLGTNSCPLEADLSHEFFPRQQNIQIMMGRVADVTDVLRSFVPYLTWRDERLTRSLFLFSVLSSFLLASVARFIPWRFVFFLLGESTLLLGHPLVQTFLADAKPRVWTHKRRKRAFATWTRLIEDDELRDDELDCEVVEVQRIEVESRIGVPPATSSSSAATASGGGGGATGSTSLSPSPSMSSLSDSLNPNGGSTTGGTSTTSEIWQPEAVVGGDLPTGFRWLSSRWQDVPPPADGAIDNEGWTYIFLDGSRSNGPSKIVVALNPAEKDKVVWAQTRRRRLTRRAIKNPLL